MYAYLEYLPGYLRLVKDYQAIGTATAPEVQMLVADQQQLAENRIFLSADELTTSRWEQILKIIPGISDDLELRRFRVAARLGSQPPYTERQMHYSLEALVGADGYKAALNMAQESLRVTIALGRKALLAEAARMLDAMVPLNIVLEVTVMYNTHAVLHGFTHAQLAAKTHYDLRNEVIDNG